MKPMSLKPGDKVICHGHVLTFIRRERHVLRPLNWFQCDAYRGLNGPTDDGTCTMSDYDVSRKCVRHRSPAEISEQKRQGELATLRNLLEMVESGDAIVGATTRSRAFCADLRQRIEALEALRPAPSTPPV